MDKFNFLTEEKAIANVYLHFPKLFVSGSNYKCLLDSASTANMFFKDRTEYSCKKTWIAKNGYIYFIYTIDEICDMLGKAKPTAIKIKKELEEANLLKQVNMGFNKEKRRQNPNRLYLADLEVSRSDIFDFDRKTQNVGSSEGKDSLPID